MKKMDLLHYLIQMLIAYLDIQCWPSRGVTSDRVDLSCFLYSESANSLQWKYSMFKILFMLRFRRLKEINAK